MFFKPAFKFNPARTKLYVQILYFLLFRVLILLTTNIVSTKHISIGIAIRMNES